LIPIPACGRLTAVAVCGLTSGMALVAGVEETDRLSGDFDSVAADELNPFEGMWLMVLVLELEVGDAAIT
jgi:hypothetical protein